MDMPSSFPYSNKFYNVKILKTYVAYLKEKYGWNEEKIERLFELCGRDITFLDSDDQWYDQVFADLFQENIQKMTGDLEISYKAGRFVFSSYAKGIQGRLLLGLITPWLVFKNIGKYSLAYSRGAKLEAVKVSRRSALLRSTPVEGCEEKPYQCQNRKGILEEAALSFGGSEVKFEEEKCVHRGGDFCEYSIAWENRTNFPAAIIAGLT